MSMNLFMQDLLLSNSLIKRSPDKDLKRVRATDAHETLDR